jgi:hypothetical protein
LSTRLTSWPTPLFGAKWQDPADLDPNDRRIVGSFKIATKLQPIADR